MIAQRCSGPDEPLHFLLDVAEAEGGACERGRETALVLLPDHLRTELGTPEELTVTADPEVAREDGATLVVHGHPVVDRVAGLVLERGDVGCSHLPWPASTPLSAGEVVLRAREALAVDHGRIDPVGTPPVEVHFPVVRVGALVTYRTSTEDRFQEREEAWVEAVSGRPLDTGLRAWLADRGTEPGPGSRPTLPADLTAATAVAHRLIEERAVARRAELAHQSDAAREGEVARARAYYTAALDGIARRSATATEDQRVVLAAKAEVTVAERDRRLAEIEERYEARHEVRPFRIHLLGLPALRVQAAVRRGDRTYPLPLTWLLGGPGLVAPGCPHCGARAPLVAGRDRLGCTTCLPRKVAPVPVPPARPTRKASSAPEPPKRDALRPAVATPHPGKPSAPRVPATASGPPKAHPRRPAPVGRRIPPPPTLQQVRSDLGEALIRVFWDAAVCGKPWPTRLIGEHTPMAALLKLYGAEGPLWAIGMTERTAPTHLYLTGTWDTGTGNTTLGWLATSGGRRTLALDWVMAPRGGLLLREILPHAYAAGALRPLAALSKRVAGALTRPPRPDIHLDPVAREIWASTTPREGINLGVRALSLWWRLQPRLGTGRWPDSAIASAVIDRARAWSGLGARHEGQGALWEADTAEARSLRTAIDHAIGQAAKAVR